MAQVNFLGVYSTRVQRANQTQVFGAKQNTTKKQLYFIWRTENKGYHRRAIDNAYNTIGDFEDLASEEFYAKYLFEPRIQVTPLTHYEEKPEELDLLDDLDDIEMAQKNEQAPQAADRPKANYSASADSTSEAFHVKSETSANVTNISKHVKEESSNPTSHRIIKEQPPLDSQELSKISSQVRLPGNNLADDDFSANYIDPLQNAQGKEQSAATSDVKSETNQASGTEPTSKLSKAKILEMELREIFALQVAKYLKERAKKCEREIEKILRREEGIVEEHRFMFSDFGVDLRKIKLYELAILAFNRAKELKEDDPNIWFNLARVNYEIREFRVAKECVEHSLKLKPDQDYAERLKAAIERASNPKPASL